MRCCWRVFPLGCALTWLWPAAAFPSSPARWNKFISIAAFGITFIIYLFNREDISGSFKLILQVVMGISGLAFAGSIVNSVFSFSGAVI